MTEYMDFRALSSHVELPLSKTNNRRPVSLQGNTNGTQAADLTEKLTVKS